MPIYRKIFLFLAGFSKVLLGSALFIFRPFKKRFLRSQKNNFQADLPAHEPSESGTIQASVNKTPTLILVD